MNFLNIKNAVASQFATMTVSGRLFVTDVSKDDMWDTYLKSFPAGTNPIFRERPEHDCNCCKSFIRAVGNVVEIAGSKVVTIWDNYPHDDGYKDVAKAMADLVRSRAIVAPFYHNEAKAGTDTTHGMLADGTLKKWNHFFVKIPSRFVKTDDCGVATNDFIQKRNVMVRGLNEITVDALDTVIELIAQNSLYRGHEHEVSVKSFKALKVAIWDKARPEDRELLAWSLAYTEGGYARIRNTAIGTLLVDLSIGVALERAVASFEAKVAPTNYKRPVSIVTASMVDNAKETLKRLGLLNALQRRHATLDDVNVNDVLYVDRGRKVKDVFDSLATAKPTFSRVETVSIKTFLENVLPTAAEVEFLFERDQLSKLVSVIAPANDDSASLFKWHNDFSWSYAGDVTDAIVERVKKAGGNVDAEVRFSLSWHNYDDLDLHLVTPQGMICFHNRRLGNGELDVDANAGGRRTREPVENIFYRSLVSMPDGNYRLYVNRWCGRETANHGFTVQVKIQDVVTEYSHTKPMGEGCHVIVMEFVKAGKVITVTDAMVSQYSQTSAWGLTTGVFVPVKAVMLSPNFWGTRSGNEHYFFILEGCLNPDNPRGFYNEFLKPELEQHRKVMEVLGSKLNVPFSEQQLSGVGFSSTQRTEFTVRVKGATTRTLKVTV